MGWPMSVLTSKCIADLTQATSLMMTQCILQSRRQKHGPEQDKPGMEKVEYA